MEPKNREVDVVIIGSGPAGLSAAIWCSELGLSAVVLETATAAGGQLNAIYGPILNYPGLSADSGAVLFQKFRESFERSKVTIKFGTEVTAIEVSRPSVQTADGAKYYSKFVIYAAGVRRRRLVIPGEEPFAGKGVITSGTREKELVSGKTVAIVGGGDAALENALLLSPFARKVYVVHRRNKFTARDEFVDGASGKDNVEFLFESEVREIVGGDSVESINVAGGNGALLNLPVDIVLIRIGVVPNTELLRGLVAVDDAGYVRVDHLGRTSAPSLYAVGDAAMPAAPTIATAVGMGAAAAKAISLAMENSRKLDQG